VSEERKKLKAHLTRNGLLFSSERVKKGILKYSGIVLKYQ